MKININDKVKVKLTPHGESVLAYENPVFYKRNFDIKNKTLKTQLWIVIDIFSSYIGGGCEQVFVDNSIYIPKHTKQYYQEHKKERIAFVQTYYRIKKNISKSIKKLNIDENVLKNKKA